MSVGVDISDFEVVIITDPQTSEEVVQKGGCVGRDASQVRNPKVIAYIPPKRMEEAVAVAAASQENKRGEPTPKKPRTKGQSTGNGRESPLDDGLAKLTVAKCKHDKITEQFGHEDASNPQSPTTSTPAMDTHSASQPTLSLPSACLCSGCSPEPPPPIPEKQKRKQHYVPVHEQVTKELKVHATAQLILYRQRLWDSVLLTNKLQYIMLGKDKFFLDDTILAIVDALAMTLTKAKIEEAVRPYPTISSFPPPTSDVSTSSSPLLQHTFDIAISKILDPFIGDIFSHQDPCERWILVQYIGILYDQLDNQRAEHHQRQKEARKGSKVTKGKTPEDSSKDEESEEVLDSEWKDNDELPYDEVRSAIESAHAAASAANPAPSPRPLIILISQRRIEQLRTGNPVVYHLLRIIHIFSIASARLNITRGIELVPDFLQQFLKIFSLFLHVNPCHLQSAIHHLHHR